MTQYVHKVQYNRSNWHPGYVEVRDMLADIDTYQDALRFLEKNCEYLNAGINAKVFKSNGLAIRLAPAYGDGALYYASAVISKQFNSTVQESLLPVIYLVQEVSPIGDDLNQEAYYIVVSELLEEVHSSDGLFQSSLFWLMEEFHDGELFGEVFLDGYSSEERREIMMDFGSRFNEITSAEFVMSDQYVALMDFANVLIEMYGTASFGLHGSNIMLRRNTAQPEGFDIVVTDPIS